MKKRLFYGHILENEGGLNKAKVNDLKYLITENDIDKKISTEILYNCIGDCNGLIPIEGSKELLSIFENIDYKKLDIPEKLENIKFEKITEENEIKLNFKDWDIEACTIYDASFDFFEDLFSMGKYEKFCFDKQFIDLINMNLNNLFSLKKDDLRKYRLIKKDGKWNIRAITSLNYKNYDNNIAIYIVICLLSRLSKKENIKFRISKGYITDSELNIFFEQDNFKHINGVGKVFFGVMLTNSEIREKKFSLELYYKIVDEQDENISFIGIKDSIFEVNHKSNVETAIRKVKEIDNLLEIEQSMLEYIREFKNIDKVDENIIYIFMQKITNSRLLLSETKDKIKDIYDKNLINNSMTILQMFNKVERISKNIEDEIVLKRIYNGIIQEIIQKMKK